MKLLNSVALLAGLLSGIRLPYIAVSGFLYSSTGTSSSRTALINKNRNSRVHQHQPQSRHFMSSSYNDADDRIDGYYPSQYLINVDKEKLAFDELFIARSNQLVMYLPNLGEGRDNPTSDSVLKFCIRRERNFLVADWFGRGDSTGKLMSATLTRWKNDVITLLDNVPTHVKPSQSGKADFKKAVLVGNGVGVWVAVLVALDRPDLVRGLVGIGGDPDFTEELLWVSTQRE
jgi:hypothetical protein